MYLKDGIFFKGYPFCNRSLYFNWGKGKAIEAAKEEKGIKLSSKAIKTNKIKFYFLNGESEFDIPKKSIVKSQDKVGVYRVRSGWFKLVDVTIKSKSGTNLKVTSNSLIAGDKIVSSRVGLIKAAQLEAFGGGGHGHVH